MKELFLDTANLEEIEQFVKTDAIQGVTTNPSLMAKEKKGGYYQRLDQIFALIECSRRKMHLSVEVITLDPREMVEQALMMSDNLRGVFVDVHVKIPVLLSTLPVITALANRKVKVNATACMTALQAKLAEDAGAAVVSFFYNRIKDGGGEPGDELNKYGALRRNTRVICGSIRKPDDVYRAWRDGSDIVTASAKVIKEMIVHPQTDKAVNDFQRDIEAWLK